MGRSPCCAKEGLNRGAWSVREDKILTNYIKTHGEGKWRDLPQRAGLKRCGKSCRLRWLNYLRPDIKRGNISTEEEDIIIKLHKLLGNRWSLIAGRLPGRTDNEIKNYWNTNLSKRVQGKKTQNSAKQQLDKMKEKGGMNNPGATGEAHRVIRTKAVRCTRLGVSVPLILHSMGRSPCCSKEGLNRGAWTAIEDKILTDYIKLHGEGRWRNLPKKAGLKRCGKSCRLRWLNYLRPDIKRGNITHDEEELIIRLHKLLGNRWSLIAGRLPGRTDNEIKNYWNTKIGKKMQENQSSSPTRKQSNDKYTKKHPDKQVSTEVVTPSLPKMLQPHVVHTKAMRCTKTFISPQAPHKLDHTNYQGAAGPSIIRYPSVDKPAEHGSV
ncbi:hypothetical protein L1049_021934 [Liquidambar formosana]|uniref:Myb-related protein 123 n=1 Tax=Liquidambar formosana TaxID=63359 RepID=A0AAP0RBR4_LIQFO